MGKNVKVCDLCKHLDTQQAKCAVCSNNDNFEPILSRDELNELSFFQVKDSNASINTFKAAVLKWGQEAQLNMIIEECVELAIASLDYNFQNFEMFDSTYHDIISSLLMFIKQALKDARKNKISLNAMPFEMDNLIDIMQDVLKREIKKQIEKKETRAELIGELADVEIMIGQARHGMGLSHEIDKVKKSKMARLQTKLEE